MRKLFPSLRRDETIINTWKQMKQKSNGTSCIQPIPKQNYTELPVKKSSLKPTTSIRFPQRKRWPSESCCRSSLPFVLLHFSRYPYHGWFLEIIKIVNKCFKRKNLFNCSSSERLLQPPPMSVHVCEMYVYHGSCETCRSETSLRALPASSHPKVPPFNSLISQR